MFNFEVVTFNDMSAAQPLSNLQQELLKLYAANVEETDLLYIKRFLAKYFAEKAINEADKIWDEKGYTNETMEQWLNEKVNRNRKDDK